MRGQRLVNPRVIGVEPVQRLRGEQSGLDQRAVERRQRQRLEAQERLQRLGEIAGCTSTRFSRRMP